MKGKGLMLVLGGGPKKAAPKMGDDEAPEGGEGDGSLAGEAFDALQDGDREGFIAAFKAAVEQCAGGGDYEDEDDSEEV